MNGFVSAISISDPFVLSTVEGLRGFFQHPAKLSSLGGAKGSRLGCLVRRTDPSFHSGWHQIWEAL